MRIRLDLFLEGDGLAYQLYPDGAEGVVILEAGTTEKIEDFRGRLVVKSGKLCKIGQFDGEVVITFRINPDQLHNCIQEKLKPMLG